ncbi:CD209 antigen-like protein C [Denticeps clupeoides]|uniref:C-type lectin domain-containing protein n=1 Tax=Denticeps clupeoides TaxID=299321 RepID=A0AAY4ARC7_9TELE|nr:CD209 antigen-like protein C [Denticeps clupeoides]
MDDQGEGLVMDDGVCANITASELWRTTGYGRGRRKRTSCSRRAAVCLGLLALVLLSVTTGLCIKYRTERDQILNRYTGLPENAIGNYSRMERLEVQLETSYTSMAEKKDRLKANCTATAEERDQLASDKRTLEAKVTQLENQLKRLDGQIFHSATKDVWRESRKYCRENGGDLVVINNRKKQFEINEMSQNGWIGLSDESEEGKWRWVDGTTPTDKFWDRGQPDIWDEVDEDCVVFHTNVNNPLLTWHDHACSTKHLAICEKSAFQ